MYFCHRENWTLPLFIIVESGLALNLSADLVLLVGSIKQVNHATLIAGLVLNGITTLGLFLFFACYFFSMAEDLKSKILSIVGIIIIIVFKIWTFVIGVGAVQEVNTI